MGRSINKAELLEATWKWILTPLFIRLNKQFIVWCKQPVTSQVTPHWEWGLCRTSLQQNVTPLEPVWGWPGQWLSADGIRDTFVLCSLPSGSDNSLYYSAQTSTQRKQPLSAARSGLQKSRLLSLYSRRVITPCGKNSLLAPVMRLYILFVSGADSATPSHKR